MIEASAGGRHRVRAGVALALVLIACDGGALAQADDADKGESGSPPVSATEPVHPLAPSLASPNPAPAPPPAPNSANPSPPNAATSNSSPPSPAVAAQPNPSPFEPTHRAEQPPAVSQSEEPPPPSDLSPDSQLTPVPRPQDKPPPQPAPPPPPAQVAKPETPPPPNLASLAAGNVIGVMGKKVRGPDGKELVGQIVDILVGNDGAPNAAVIDVGGFLGVGSRKIAVDWGLLKFSPADHDAPVSLGLGRAEIQSAPEYKEAKAPVEVVIPPAEPEPSAAAEPSAAQAPSAGSAPSPASASPPASAPTAPSAAPAPPAAPESSDAAK